MKAFFAEEQKRHEPKAFLSSGAPKPNPEQPERVERLLSGAKAAGCTIARPNKHGLGPVAAVHTPEYLDFLEHIFVRWQRIGGASEEVIPNIHPIARGGSYPASAVGQAGYHMADTACPISANTFDSALWSAWCAVEAAEAVLAGTPAAYALCRPPGHHAFADGAGGFCFVNNSAVAAQVLRKSAARVAILDVDCSGTERRDLLCPPGVLTSRCMRSGALLSVFWGPRRRARAKSRPRLQFNLPLPRKSGDEIFLETLEVAFRRIRAFAPDALVVALGLDAFEGDPFGGLSATTPGFSRIAQAIAKLGLPTTIVQEGGYLCDALGDNLTAFLTGFAGAGR